MSLLQSIYSMTSSCFYLAVVIFEWKSVRRSLCYGLVDEHPLLAEGMFSSPIGASHIFYNFSNMEGDIKDSDGGQRCATYNAIRTCLTSFDDDVNRQAI